MTKSDVKETNPSESEDVNSEMNICDDCRDNIQREFDFLQAKVKYNFDTTLGYPSLNLLICDEGYFWSINEERYELDKKDIIEFLKMTIDEMEEDL